MTDINLATYNPPKVSKDPFNLKKTVKELQKQVEDLRRVITSDILHIHIGEVVSISEKGVETADQTVSEYGGGTQKVQIKSLIYKVHKFDGNTIPEVYYNGALCQQAPPIIGSIILFIRLGNDYYVMQTLATKRAMLLEDDEVSENNPDFIDIDRKLKPGFVRITEAQDGATMFLGDGSIRLAGGSPANNIAIINHESLIRAESTFLIGDIDNSVAFITSDTDSIISLSKNTLIPAKNSYVTIDTDSNISLQTFYDSIKMEPTKIEVMKTVAPYCAFTMDNMGKITLGSNTGLDPTTNEPIYDTALSQMSFDKESVIIKNALLSNITMDTTKLEVATVSTTVKQDVTGVLIQSANGVITIQGTKINLVGPVSQSGPPGAEESGISELKGDIVNIESKSLLNIKSEVMKVDNKLTDMKSATFQISSPVTKITSGVLDITSALIKIPGIQTSINVPGLGGIVAWVPVAVNGTIMGMLPVVG